MTIFDNTASAEYASDNEFDCQLRISVTMSGISSNRTSIDEMPRIPSVSASILLWRSLWGSRVWIASTTGVVAIAAVIYSLLTPPLYEATVTATAADDLSHSVGGLSSIASQLGVDGLVGLELPNPPLTEALTVLKSRALTEHFLKKYNVLPELYPYRWDADKKQWKPPSALTRFMRGLQGLPQGDGSPSIWDAVKKMDRVLKVDVDRKNEIVLVSVDWTDPAIAAKWANEIVHDTDEVLRQRTLTETGRSIAFLEAQAAQASLSELRQSIYSVATQELRRSMLANVRANFALKVLDPAVPPEERSWPRRTLLVVVATIFGFFLGCLIALARTYIEDISIQARVR